MTRLQRARAVQIVGATLVAFGLFLAVLLGAGLHFPAGGRLGVALVVVGAVALVVAAALRWWARRGAPRR